MDTKPILEATMIDATYSNVRTGYEQAYFDKQCLLNHNMMNYVWLWLTLHRFTEIDDGTGTVICS